MSSAAVSLSVTVTDAGQRQAALLTLQRRYVSVDQTFTRIQPAQITSATTNTPNILQNHLLNKPLSKLLSNTVSRTVKTLKAID